MISRLLTSAALLLALFVPVRAEAQNTIVLTPGGGPPMGPSGRDPLWQSRPSLGKPTWGFPANHETGKADTGAMWWDKFPGPTGRYKISVSIILDSDGEALYKLHVGTKDGSPIVVSEGIYPRPPGSSPCSDVKKVGEIAAGEHDVRQGEPIRFWAQSNFCKTPTRYSGNVARYWEIRFTPAGPIKASVDGPAGADDASSPPPNPPAEDASASADSSNADPQPVDAGPTGASSPSMPDMAMATALPPPAAADAAVSSPVPTGQQPENGGGCSVARAREPSDSAGVFLLVSLPFIVGSASKLSEKRRA